MYVLVQRYCPRGRFARRPIVHETSMIRTCRLWFGMGPAVCCAVCCAALGTDARAAIFTSFQGAMQPGTPASGWSYLWNSNDLIGIPALYTPLLPTTHESAYYDEDGVDGLPTPGTDNFVFMGLVDTSAPTTGGMPGGHPGSGPDQASSGGIARFAIAAYTLPTGGNISITNSLLMNADTVTQGGSVDGLDVQVFVNDNPTPFAASSTVAGALSSTTFDINLGTLSAGDIIYVGIGPRANDLADSFALEYDIDISAVPEPSSLLIFTTCTGMCLAARVWRSRRSRRQS